MLEDAVLKVLVFNVTYPVTPSEDISFITTKPFRRIHIHVIVSLSIVL